MPSNPPPPRAHKLRVADALPDSPQRLPQLTAGSSSAATSPQRPPSSTGTGSLGPPHRPPPPPPSSQQHASVFTPPAQSTGPARPASTEAPCSPRVNSSSAAQAISFLPAWVHLDLVALSGLPSPSSRATGASRAMAIPAMQSPVAAPAAATRASPTRAAPRLEEPQHAASTRPTSNASEDPAALPTADARLMPAQVQPPPLSRVASAGTLYHSPHGLAPLIEWVPVPGWDDTEMCRGEGGGYFKADATTGRPYRVNWVRPRDFSRPPTVASSGAATPVSPSPLPVQAESFANVTASDPVQPPGTARGEAAARVDVGAHRHLRFEPASPHTLMATPKRTPAATSAASSPLRPSAGPSPVVPRAAVAAAGPGSGAAHRAELFPAPTAPLITSTAHHHNTHHHHTAAGAAAAATATLTPAISPPQSPGMKAPQPSTSPIAAATPTVAVANDVDNAQPSSSYVFPWLSSSNRASGATSGSDERVSARLLVPPEVMLRRSLPVASDGYGAHGCSVFTGVRNDGTVSVVMLEPYPKRHAHSPWPVRPPPPPSPQQHPQQRPQWTPQAAAVAQRQERTWPSASPPRSPSAPRPPPPQQMQPQQQQPQQQQQQEEEMQRRRPSTSTGPVFRSRTGTPRTSPPTAVRLGSAGKSSSAFLIPPPRVPNLRQQSAGQHIPPSQQPSRNVAGRHRGRGGPSVPTAASRPSLDADREASSPTTAVAATASVMAPAAPSKLTVWSPLMAFAPPTAAAATSGMAASALVTSRTTSSGPQLPPPPPLPPFPAVPIVAASTTTTPHAPPPSHPLAATVTPHAHKSAETSQQQQHGSRGSGVASDEIAAFVQAAARARGRQQQPQQQQLQPQQEQHQMQQQREVQPQTPSPLPRSTSQKSRRSSRRPKASSHRTPATADVVPPTKPPPHLSIAALSLTDTPVLPPPSPLPATKTVTTSLLPSWCLGLVDALLTPLSQGAACTPQQQPPPPQRPPSAPTPTSGTTTGGTTAGSDVDSRLWSVEMRNGVQIGWTLKTVTAAERARATAAAAAATAGTGGGGAGGVAAAGRPLRGDKSECGSHSLLEAPDELNALSSPMPFSLATPDATSVPNATTQFLRAASQPEMMLYGRRGAGGAAALEPTAGQHLQQQDHFQGRPHQEQQQQQQQQRHTHTFIMTHSGMNAQASLNDFGAALPGGGAHASPRAPPAQDGPGAGVAPAGADGITPSTDLLGGNAEGLSTPANDGEGEEERDDDGRERMSFTTVLPATPAADTTTAPAHMDSPNMELSATSTLLHFQNYHQQHQQKQRGEATARRVVRESRVPLSVLPVPTRPVNASLSSVREVTVASAPTGREVTRNDSVGGVGGGDSARRGHRPLYILQDNLMEEDAAGRDEGVAVMTNAEIGDGGPLSSTYVAHGVSDRREVTSSILPEEVEQRSPGATQPERSSAPQQASEQQCGPPSTTAVRIPQKPPTQPTQQHGRHSMYSNN